MAVNPLGRPESRQATNGPGSAVGREQKERQVLGCGPSSWNGGAKRALSLHLIDGHHLHLKDLWHRDCGCSVIVFVAARAADRRLDRGSSKRNAWF